MENDQLKMIIEGALLAAGRELSLNQLEKLFDEDLIGQIKVEATASEDQEHDQGHKSSHRPERDQIKAVLEDIAADCQGRGFELKQTGSGYRFQVRQEVSQWINKLWDEKPKKYSRALLETLSLIAYRQPITRGDIEEIRGVSVSSEIIKSLLEREWVRVVGHRDVPGRPALYATTRQFLDYFSLKSLEQLPALNEIKDIEDINPELALQVAQNEVAQNDIAQNFVAANEEDGVETGSSDQKSTDQESFEIENPDIESTDIENPEAVSSEDSNTENNQSEEPSLIESNASADETLEEPEQDTVSLSNPKHSKTEY